ncbi:CvpA family protein [Methylomonas methanica]|uniref:Colicin V production protein n=1 Tax=Methylomonas methanica (strain DSM 25384 / MC09) TaxID=857087 RepID=G0A407_METMM|nr:CvpA family protein [Methylomonas methanica]AEF99054.1 Colicin V production protein [Methylomonas methanica MC09]
MVDSLSLDRMIWVDYAISVLILVSAVMGLLRGFIKEAFALTLWVAAIWVGMHYSRDFAVLLQNTISHPSARVAAAFGLLFFMTLILGGLIGFILNQLIEKTGLTGSDRILGMLFGVLRGAVLVSVLVMLGGITPLPEDPWWKQSLLIPPFQSLAVWLKDHIPSALTGYIHFR